MTIETGREIIRFERKRSAVNIKQKKRNVLGSKA